MPCSCQLFLEMVTVSDFLEFFNVCMMISFAEFELSQEAEEPIHAQFCHIDSMIDIIASRGGRAVTV